MNIAKEVLLVICLAGITLVVITYSVIIFIRGIRGEL